MIERDINISPEQLERTGRLHHVHYLVLGVSFLLTVAIWQYSEKQALAQVEAAFDRSADQVLELTKERMQRYEDGLWAGVALINANRGQVDLQAWRAFAETLQIDTKYPGINGIGVILNVPATGIDEFVAGQKLERPYFDIHPAHERGLFLPITFIEPENINRPAVGLDMSFEENRLGGVLRARDTGLAQITGPITLVQDEGATPGFLFYAPFYGTATKGLPSTRQDSFLGVVYAPFVVRKLMEGVLDPTRRNIWVSISDGDHVIYDEHSADEPGYDPDPMFTRKIDLQMFGRVWQMDIRTTMPFRAANSKSQPYIILACGITIDILLLALFILLSRSNLRTLSYADRVTEALRREKRELQESNTALEQFAYVASHDLKTPIRSMRDVTDYLVEDLRNGYPQALNDVAIGQQLSSLRGLIDRMDKLVKGVFAYSQITQKSPREIEFSSDIAIRGMAEGLRISPDRLQLLGDFPTIRFPPDRFNQIIHNLFENCLRHHENPDDMQISVTATVQGADVSFAVSDNGPGIDPRYHAKIFEMFQILHPDRATDGAGVGLAIVRRATEASGGTVTILSRPSEGTTMTITLPGIAVPPPSAIAAE